MIALDVAAMIVAQVVLAEAVVTTNSRRNA